MHYWVVMPAAGFGQRFGGPTPKQYALLLDRPLIVWSLAPFLEDPRCRGIQVAVAPDDPQWPAVAALLDPRRVAACAGGSERF